MKPKVVGVKLTETDLWFITESMSANIPNSDDMTPEERATFEKMHSALQRSRK